MNDHTKAYGGLLTVMHWVGIMNQHDCHHAWDRFHTRTQVRRQNMRMILNKLGL